MNDKNIVKNYFKSKAKDYDLTDDQKYWVLSDQLLWHILNEQVLYKLNKGFQFVDVGAGTGRWTKNILDHYRDASGLLLDLSDAMLEQARVKMENYRYDSKTNIIQCDLDTIDLSDRENQFDIAYSFHNVLGFVKDPKNVIRKMSAMVKKGGYIVCGVPNYYHCIFFNNFVNNISLSSDCFKKYKGKFTPDMPDMTMFTPTGLREIYQELNIEVQGVHGFPVSIYPGMQETQLHGETEQLVDVLSDEENFKTILEIEKSLYLHKDAAGRGNQLIIIGKKI